MSFLLQLLLSISLIATPTMSAVAIPQTSTSCNGIGFQYAIFNNTRGNDFNIMDMKSPRAGGRGTQDLLQYNVTSTLGTIKVSHASTSRVNVYRGPTAVGPDNFFVPHRGYLRAVTGGTYVFNFAEVDDAAYLWIGNLAKSGWTRDNAVSVVGTTPQGAPGSGSYAVTLSQGQYLPVRIAYVQATWDGVFRAAVTAPGGREVFNGNYHDPAYVMKYSCENPAAAPNDWSSWGNEM